MRKSCIALILLAAGARAAPALAEPSTAQLYDMVTRLQARVIALEAQATRDRADATAARAELRRVRGAVPAPVVHLAPAPVVHLAPVNHPRPWTHAYIGGAGEFALSNARLSSASSVSTISRLPTTVLTSAPFPTSFSEGANTRSLGARSTLLAGIDYQFAGRFVLGAQGELGIAAVPLNQQTGTLTNFGPFATPLLGYQTSRIPLHETWRAGAMARLGYLLTDDFLIYALGGPAFAHVQDDAAGSSRIVRGADVGGGFEHRIGQNWSAFAEYRFTKFLPSTSATLAQTASLSQVGLLGSGLLEFDLTQVTSNARFTYENHAIRVGARYNFDLQD